MASEYLSINLFGLVEGTAHGPMAVGSLTAIAIVVALVSLLQRLSKE